jgi:hypothetical protein
MARLATVNYAQNHGKWPKGFVPLGHFWFLDGKRPDSTGLGTQLFAFSKDCIPIVDFDAIEHGIVDVNPLFSRAPLGPQNIDHGWVNLIFFRRDEIAMHLDGVP